MGLFDRLKGNITGNAAGRIPFTAYKGDKPYIFISYAHKDAQKVFVEITKFHHAGYHVWYDEGIAPGNEWTDEIALALEGCALFVVFITPQSAASQNVQNEINFAIDERKPFLAIHLEPTTLRAGLKLQIGTKQAILQYNMTEEEYVYKYTTAFERMGLVAQTMKPSESEKRPAAVQSVQTRAAGQPTNPDDIELVGDFEVQHGLLHEYLGTAPDIRLPDQVEVIGYSSFGRGSRFIETVDLNRVGALLDNAFTGCSNLRLIKIPRSVTMIKSKAFVNCPNLTVHCYRDHLPADFEENFGGKEIVYLDDVAHEKGSIQKELAAPLKQTGEGNEKIIPFWPNGSVTIVMQDGIIYKAIANTMLFGCNLQHGLAPYLFYSGVDENAEEYRIETLISFEDILRIAATPPVSGKDGQFAVTDVDGGQRQKILDTNSFFMFISESNQKEMTKIPAIDVRSMDFDWGNTPDYTIPTFCVELTNGESIFVTSAFFTVLHGGGMYRDWEPLIPFPHHGNVPFKRMKILEVTEVVESPSRFKPITHVKLRIEKRNGEVIDDEYDGILTIWTLSRYGICTLSLSEVKKILFYEADQIRGTIDSGAAMHEKNPVQPQIKTRAVDNDASTSDFEVDYGTLKKYHGNATHVEIPYGVAIINGHAFDGCENLESVVVPEKVKSINICAFYSCKRLSSIILPASIRNLCSAAFIDCPLVCLSCYSQSLDENFAKTFSGFEIIYLDAAPPAKKSLAEPKEAAATTDIDFEIEHGVLKKYHGNAAHVEIPYGVVEISAYAFKSCELLESVAIPDKVRKIAICAFITCKRLSSVTLPSTVQNLQPAAFCACNMVRLACYSQSLSADFEKNFSGFEVIYLDERVSG